MTSTPSFEHDALLYSGIDEFVAGTSDFLAESCEAREPVMVAIPGDKIDPLRQGLNTSSDQMRFVDMHELGRNPGRIIPEIHGWMKQQGGRRCRLVGEPIWGGRTREETIEATRHEALINLAFANCNAHVLCPYDTGVLAAAVVADAARTHPGMICGHERRQSDSYADPLDVWLARDWSLSEPPAGVPAIGVTSDLAAVRRVASDCAAAAGLTEIRTDDIVLAVDEAATNAVQHGQDPIFMRFWCDERQLIFEVTDSGQFDQPLAGRRRPEPDWPAGRGLWLINQLCDLVEVRPGGQGTTVRLHVDL